MLENDIYYLIDYANLYLKSDEEIFDFEYIQGGKILKNIAIKRPIPQFGTIKCNEEFYDLESPYGYGGFWSNTQDADFIGQALKEYEKKCEQNRIVAEFYRFNPFNDFPLNFGQYFDFLIRDRETVYVQLDKPYETIYKEYHPSLRRNLRKAEKNNLHFSMLNPTLDNIRYFQELYYKTMKKNRAESFYFFPKTYFENLFKLKNAKLFGILYEDKIINMVVVLESAPICYYHLGASIPEYYALNGNPFLFDQLIQYYRSRFSIFYLGGGATSAENDSLLRFKRKFSPTTKPFYIAGKIFNKEKYQEFVKMAEKKCPDLKSIKYFLKYRLCQNNEPEEKI
ncbi:hypothetical protein Calab_2794 [Caldithrix abyssi DSM 13497]|uniref:Acetyltransferase (GNAT) domain-containing protein n=1 Tax=Caldithrix abyssi DSM 13497 TaxID=880073 RepID=H1XRC0_CALAY|nr:hypothetical protein [Caldithrix abyssi]APF18390.1 hypothetical protein Cabys_1641 [Caldithrix abyssi DSM 13497]EHO42401.1 hypothetical protein Calab_2794 [Caldithrix abyssi DSM 13497]